MKKEITVVGIAGFALIALIGFLLFLEVKPGQPVVNTNTAPPMVDEGVDTSDWLTYRDEELGIEFRYPSNAKIATSREITNFDAGKRKNINIILDDTTAANFIATSADYKEGISEGFGYIYSGKTLDHSLNSEQIINTLASDLDVFSTPIKENLNIRNAFSFYVTYGYGGFFYSKSYLISIDTENYSNLQIIDGKKHEAINIVKGLPSAKWTNQMIESFEAAANNNTLDSSNTFEQISRTLSRI